MVGGGGLPGGVSQRLPEHGPHLGAEPLVVGREVDDGGDEVLLSLVELLDELGLVLLRDEPGTADEREGHGVLLDQGPRLAHRGVDGLQDLLGQQALVSERQGLLDRVRVGNAQVRGLHRHERPPHADVEVDQ